jgi:tRNA (guanine-N7-)-methyltransferase
VRGEASPRAAIAAESLRFYGRRQGRALRPGRLAVFRDHIDALAIRLPEGQMTRLDPRLLFNPPRQRVWLEVGFGGGEHLLGQAARHPEIGFIGCEPFIPGVATLVARAVSGGLTARLRIFANDARLLLPHFADASIERTFILFPDPWPKRRHHRRRVVDAAMVDRLAHLLSDDGELLVATDHAEYAADILAFLTAHPAFLPSGGGSSHRCEPPPDWVATRYEGKARRAGREVQYLRFFRRARLEKPGLP